jgi:hypothetical protein
MHQYIRTRLGVNFEPIHYLPLGVLKDMKVVQGANARGWLVLVTELRTIPFAFRPGEFLLFVPNVQMQSHRRARTRGKIQSRVLRDKFPDALPVKSAPSATRA